MKLGKASRAGMLAVFGLSPLGQTYAQVPVPPPPGPSALAVPAVAAAPAVPVAPQPTLWGFLGITKAGCAAHKEKICQSQLGLMINGILAPAGALTGGLIPPCCPPFPTLTPEEIAALPGGADGAQAVAAKIQAEEAQAKARVAAVEYLGTVDCHYWIEARDALILALRTDRNECVRFAAARVLGSGCCCNKLTIEALTITMTASEKDGNPSETSPRVRAAAQAALFTCLARYKEPVELEPAEPKPVVPLEPEQPTPEQPTPETPEPALEARTGTAAGPGQPLMDSGVQLSAYYRAVERKPAAAVIQDARRALQAVASQRPAPIMTTGQRSVLHAFNRARDPRVAAAARPGQAAAPAPAYGQSPSYPAPIPAQVPAPTYSSAAVAPVDPGVMSTSMTYPEPQASPKRDRSLLGIFSESRRGSR